MEILTTIVISLIFGGLVALIAWGVYMEIKINRSFNDLERKISEAKAARLEALKEGRAGAGFLMPFDLAYINTIPVFKFDKQGRLHMRRKAKDWKPLCCFHDSISNCGDWCPHCMAETTGIRFTCGNERAFISGFIVDERQSASSTPEEQSKESVN